MRVLDLFCGCGGLSLGFQNANFEIAGGIDFDKDCIDTYQLNFPNAKSFCGDVSKFDKNTILENYKNIDVIIGGPPCQGFSSANMWEKNKKYDYRNYLFRDFIRFVKVINPKVAIIENVSRILTIENGEIKKGIENQFKDLGYKVNNKVLIASDYGVPQKRKRNFFVAMREEYQSFDFESIKKKDIVTVGEALSDLYELEDQSINFSTITSKISSNYQKIMRDKNDHIYNHNPKYPMEKVQERMNHVKEGENWKAVPENLWDTKRNNRHSSAYKRLDSNDTSITIDCGHMNYFHPKFNRVPTVRESARIQSFPDKFKFEGKQGSQFSQVGNAVPPLLAESLALAIRQYICK